MQKLRVRARERRERHLPGVYFAGERIGAVVALHIDMCTPYGEGAIDTEGVEIIDDPTLQLESKEPTDADT